MPGIGHIDVRNIKETWKSQTGMPVLSEVGALEPSVDRFTSVLQDLQHCRKSQAEKLMSLVQSLSTGPGTQDEVMGGFHRPIADSMIS
jgi:hypothetical protein